MSNWTLKQAFSELMSKFHKSDSDESSSYSSAADVDNVGIDDAEDAVAVSPLALRAENSPESWLGRFLLMLDLGGVTKYGTIAGAKRDSDLYARLAAIQHETSQQMPQVLFDTAATADLKSRDWAAWWRSQSAMTGYCYSALSLAMLDDISQLDKVAEMYFQNTNSRIQRDAYFVLCYLLKQEWPGYEVTPGDIEVLRQHN